MQLITTNVAIHLHAWNKRFNIHQLVYPIYVCVLTAMRMTASSAEPTNTINCGSIQWLIFNSLFVWRLCVIQKGQLENL